MYIIKNLCIFICMISGVKLEVGPDFNCTRYDSTLGDHVWLPSAVACDNVYPDYVCQNLMLAGPPPRVGISEIRTYRCWSELPNPVPPYSAHPDVIRDAALACPKTCALCCMTSAYNCRNAEFPRLNCATIVPAQCRDQRWRTIIAQDCPSACGFCNLGGCVDAVADCANDPSICNSIGMQVFVNQNCQRTCSRCPSSTSARISSSTTSITSTCSSYNPDSSSSCAAWAANGFCTNTHYTVARRKATCATTCRIC